MQLKIQAASERQSDQACIFKQPVYVAVGDTISIVGTQDLVIKFKRESWSSDMQTQVKLCNKDKGHKAKLRQRSRGHFMCVTGGGHIMFFNPQYK